MWNLYSREERSKTASSSWDVVVLHKRSRVTPVPETNAVTDGCSSEIDNETED